MAKYFRKKVFFQFNFLYDIEGFHGSTLCYESFQFYKLKIFMSEHF